MGMASQRRKRIFIGYSPEDGAWVFGKLAPCLRAGGTDPLVDVEQSRAGRSLIGHLDALQDKADVQVLLLSRYYLKSPNCLHEMKRALKSDPDLRSSVIIVKRRSCDVPTHMQRGLFREGKGRIQSANASAIAPNTPARAPSKGGT